MSNSDELGPASSRRKMERARPMGEEMDGKVFISRQSRHFSFDVYSYKYFSLFVPGLGL